MLKKLALLALILCGAAICAEDRVGIYIATLGDDDAKIELECGSSAATVRNPVTRNPKLKLVQRSIMVALNGTDPVEVEFEAKAAANGIFRIVCQGWGEGMDHVYAECTKLEINGKEYIPNEKFKTVEFYGYRRMMEDLPVKGEETFKVKATFAKVSDDRAAELAAAAERRAAAKKAREAKKAAK